MRSRRRSPKHPRSIISERESELPPSNIGKLLKIAEESKTIISLGPGEPDFPSPPNIIRAAQAALRNKQTHYAPVEGRSDLKEAIIKKLRRENRISAGMENVLVTTGSTEGLLLGLMATMDPGEAVFTPDPGFLAYQPMIEILNGIPLRYCLHEETAFAPQVADLNHFLLPEKTNALILNTPSNPTGAVYSKRVLEAVAEFAIENDLLILSDEAYERFVYDDAKHISIASLNGLEDRVLTLHSFSKTYAMPGFRLGWATGPEQLIKAMSKLHVFTTLSSPTVSQVAGIEALSTRTVPAIQRMLREYDARRRFLVPKLNKMGLRCSMPKGAFYAFARVPDEQSSQQFAEWLLKKGVACVPGPEFGRHGEGYVRFSYATALPKIQAAVKRMEAAL